MPGVTAVVHRDREVLLVRRADDGEWAPVTGIVDPGEEPAACGAREVLEETGILAPAARPARASGTGIVRPGEEPAACAAREGLEETGILARVERLASTSVMRDVVHPNGDRAARLGTCV